METLRSRSYHIFGARRDCNDIQCTIARLILLLLRDGKKNACASLENQLPSRVAGWSSSSSSGSNWARLTEMLNGNLSNSVKPLMRVAIPSQALTFVGEGVETRRQAPDSVQTERRRYSPDHEFLRQLADEATKVEAVRIT